MAEIGTREWWGNLITLILFGSNLVVFGADRFYRGQIGWGIVKLITAGGIFIWVFVDVIRYAYRFGKTGQWCKSPLELPR